MALTKIRGSTQIQALSTTNSEIAFPDAANPDGILLAKIEDGAILVKADGSVPFTAPQGGVAPVSANDLTTKAYVDAVASGLDVKNSVRAISVTPITMSGPQTVDGVALIAGDRVLVAGQAAGETNGIYVVQAGAWVRSDDADGSPSDEVTSGMFTFIEEGTSYAGSGWVLTTANPIVLGTTPLDFAQFSAAGTIQAGAGLTKSGNTIDVNSANAGIAVNANDIELKVSADGTLAIGVDGVKLAPLASGKVLIGSAGNVATAQTLTGDVTVSVAGVTTITAGAVTVAKLEVLTPGQIILGGAAGNIKTTLSGDVTMDDAGVVTINPATVVRVADIIKREEPAGAVDGTNAVFVLANTPKVGLEDVYLNGILQEGAGNDYAISGDTITFTFNPMPGDKVRVSYYK